MLDAGDVRGGQVVRGQRPSHRGGGVDVHGQVDLALQFAQAQRDVRGLLVLELAKDEGCGFAELEVGGGGRARAERERRYQEQGEGLHAPASIGPRGQTQAKRRWTSQSAS